MNNDIAILFGGNPLDLSTIEPQGDFQVIPPGKYPVLIEEAEVRLTKKGDGHYIKLVMKILEGPYANRKLFDQINIDNPSAQCVDIGTRVMTALGLAIGLTALTDTAQLVNQVVVAHVKVKNDQNDIRTYSSPSQVPCIAAPVPVQPQQTAQPAQPQQATPAAVAEAMQIVATLPVGGTVTTPSPAPSAPAEKPPWDR